MTSDFWFLNYDVISDFVTLIFQVQPIDMGLTEFARKPGQRRALLLVYIYKVESVTVFLCDLCTRKVLD